MQPTTCTAFSPSGYETLSTFKDFVGLFTQPVSLRTDNPI